MSFVHVAGGMRHAWERVAILGIVYSDFLGAKSDSTGIHYTTTAYMHIYPHIAV